MDLPSRRNQLKQATAAAHQSLDDLIGVFDSEQAYRRYLVGMARFRLPIDGWLGTQAMPVELEDWRPGIYDREMRQDLADLDLDIPEPMHPFAPPPGNGLLGLLYVLEGSALGARLLAKRAEKLGYTDCFAARHLFSQARNLSNWPAFSSRMERVCVYDQQAAAAWANTAFDYARRAFESP